MKRLYLSKEEYLAGLPEQVREGGVLGLDAWCGHAAPGRLFGVAESRLEDEVDVRMELRARGVLCRACVCQGKSMKGAWEYVLVERMEKPTQTSGGLFLPANDKDPLYIVRIVRCVDCGGRRCGGMPRSDGVQLLYERRVRPRCRHKLLFLLVSRRILLCTGLASFGVRNTASATVWWARAA